MWPSAARFNAGTLALALPRQLGPTRRVDSRAVRQIAAVGVTLLPTAVGQREQVLGLLLVVLALNVADD